MTEELGHWELMAQQGGSERTHTWLVVLLLPPSHYTSSVTGHKGRFSGYDKKGGGSVKRGSYQESEQ